MITLNPWTSEMCNIHMVQNELVILNEEMVVQFNKMDKQLLQKIHNVIIVAKWVILLATVTRSNATKCNRSTICTTNNILRPIIITINVIRVLHNQITCTIINLCIRLHLTQKTESWVHQRLRIKQS